MSVSVNGVPVTVVGVGRSVCPGNTLGVRTTGFPDMVTVVFVGTPPPPTRLELELLCPGT